VIDGCTASFSGRHRLGRSRRSRLASLLMRNTNCSLLYWTQRDSSVRWDSVFVKNWTPHSWRLKLGSNGMKNSKTSYRLRSLKKTKIFSQKAAIFTLMEQVSLRLRTNTPNHERLNRQKTTMNSLKRQKRPSSWRICLVTLETSNSHSCMVISIIGCRSRWFQCTAFPSL